MAKQNRRDIFDPNKVSFSTRACPPSKRFATRLSPMSLGLVQRTSALIGTRG